MKFALCIFGMAVIAGCGGRDRSSAPAASALGDTTATAAAGEVRRASAPPAAAPDAATDTGTAPASRTGAGAAPAVARIAGPGAVLGSKKRNTRSAATTPAAGTTHARSADTGGTPAAASGTVKVNQFMSYDRADKTVEVQLFAAYDHSLGGFNFNGGFSGNQTITVPQGWTVHMHVVNKDAIPHSAIIIAAHTPVPPMPDKAAIPRAYTTHLTDGLAPGGGSDDLDFKASPAGSYFLACGVPGHAASGMYIRFEVSGSAATPTYKQ